MAGYKEEVTLNERDSLQDMLNFEKELMNAYSVCMAEGVSKGYRNLLKENWEEAAEDRLKVYLMMTEKDYARVNSAPEEMLKERKRNYEKIKRELA